MYAKKLAAVFALAVTSSGAFGFENFDDKLRNLSYQHPEFAGLHTDKAGNLILSVTEANIAGTSDTTPIVFAPSYASAQTMVDPGLLESLQAIVGEYEFKTNLYRESQDGFTVIDSEGNVVKQPERKLGIKQVSHSFGVLYDWYRGARDELLSMPGVEGGDIDEAQNNITVFISDEADFASLHKVIDSYGIPRDAVTFEMTSKASLTASLRDAVSPRRGGLQIAFKLTPSANDSFCSIGFFTRIGGVLGYVTASHCSRTHGVASDGTTHYQGPSTSTGTFVGSPTISSTGYACGSRTCFESDSLFVPRPAGVTSRQWVAKANSINTGSLTIRTGSNSTWTNLIFPTSTLVGHAAFKTGRTTGTTSGDVTRVCVDLNIAGIYRYICLNEVLGDGGPGSFVDGGDSGSA
ncbi:MAG: hypothetical protein AAGI44_09680, partial [Pseudomonadota bacterium]